MVFLISRLQRSARHPDIEDLGFVCECGHRTRSQLNSWAQWYVDGETWEDRCESCGKWWAVTLRARPASRKPGHGRVKRCKHPNSRAYFDIREPGRHVLICDDCESVLTFKKADLPDTRTDAYVTAFMAGAAGILRVDHLGDEPVLDSAIVGKANVLAGSALDAMLATGCVELKN